jgi:hypothetical protein
MTARMKLLSDRLFEAEGTGSGPSVAVAAEIPAIPEKSIADQLYPDDKAALKADAKPVDLKAEAKVEAEQKTDDKKSDEKAEDKPKLTDAQKAEAEKVAAEALKQVPEDGKYEFTLPDGIELDKDLAEFASPKLKEAGVTRDQANKLAAIISEARTNETKKAFEAWDATQTKWQGDVKADKEIGGDKFDASIAAASKAINKFGTPELKEYLKASGGGNHPELIRFISRVGNAFSDDKPIGSGNAASESKTLANVLYPDN